MGLHPKIKTLDELVFLAEKLKTEGKKIVLSHGDFDLIRYGHLHYLEESKKLGDVLIVSVVADEFVRKGPEKPIFDESTRAHLIALLECVDYIVICQYFGPWGIIEKLKPDVYTKDERASVQLNNPHSGVSRDKATIESVGGIFVLTKTISSSSTDVLDGY
ncbi:MAG: adenylyltransferase/cytidyltransferase family protein, partial [bacterium]|nr:adenylyltransferase/cytidyltransferase family protein [bacterium]